MTKIYNLRAATNVTFRLTRDFSDLAQVYDLVSSTIRMQARVTALANDPPIYEWCSTNVSGGVASFDTATGLCVFSAPASDMSRMPARLVYDCRLELSNGAITPLFSGRMEFTQGVTRCTNDAAAIGLSSGDTVFAEGETLRSALPVALTAAVAAAHAAEVAASQSATTASQSATGASQSATSASQSATAAAQSAQVAASGAASLTPDALAASFASLSSSQAAALAQVLIAALPDMSSGAVPVASGQAFVDASGFLVRAG